MPQNITEKMASFPGRQPPVYESAGKQLCDVKYSTAVVTRFTLRSE